MGPLNCIKIHDCGGKREWVLYDGLYHSGTHFFRDHLCDGTFSLETGGYRHVIMVRLCKPC